MARAFRELFCEHYRCRPEEYPNRVFWHCLRWYVTPLAALIKWLRPRFFSRDFEVIQSVGNAISERDFRNETDGLTDVDRLERKFLRSRLHVRISCEKLLALRARLATVETARPDLSR